MSQRTTSDRGSRIGRRQTQVSSRRPCRGSAGTSPAAPGAAVRVELLASRAAAFEPGHERIDQSLGLAQLGRRHPLEFLVAQQLAAAVGVGRDDDALDRRLVVGLLARSVGAASRAPPGASKPARTPGSGGLAPWTTSSAAACLAARASDGWNSGRRSAAPAAPSARRRRRRPARSSRRRTKIAAPAARTCSRSPMSTSVRARAKSTAAPRSMASPRGPQRAPEPDRLASRRRPSTSGPNGRADDRGIGHRIVAQPPAAASAR